MELKQRLEIVYGLLLSFSLYESLISLWQLLLLHQYISSMLMVLLLIIIQPFKANLSRYSNINFVFFLLLISWYVSVIGLDMATFMKHDAIWPFYILCLIFGFLPALYGFAIILYWIFSQKKFGFELIRRVRAFRQGYDWWALE